MTSGDAFIAAREAAIAKSHGYRIDPAVWDEAFSAAWQAAHRRGRGEAFGEAAALCDKREDAFGSFGPRHCAIEIRALAAKEEA